VARHARLLGGLLSPAGRQPPHPVHRPLARSYLGRSQQRREHARHRLVHHDPARRGPQRTNRVIDGIDQLGWRTGAKNASNGDGYIYWMGPQMYGVKWQKFKLVLVAQKYMQDAAAKLPTPRLINLTTDPRTRASQPASSPQLGRSPFQQDHRRVRDERPERAADIARGTTDHVPRNSRTRTSRGSRASVR